MALNLPTFESEDKVRFDKVSPKFDWLTGEFLFDNAGRMLETTPREALENWCLKVTATERFTRLCYSEKIGVELATMPQVRSAARAKARVIRTITDALKVHRQVESVKNFSFRRDADEAQALFDVQFKNGDTSRLTIRL